MKIEKGFLILFTSILLISASCHKDITVIEYKGEVIRAVTDCSVATGTPYIIKYTATNVIDSFITTSLPSAFQTTGSKILFKMRIKVPSNEAMVCITSIIPPIQQSIYDVKSQ